MRRRRNNSRSVHVTALLRRAAVPRLTVWLAAHGGDVDRVVELTIGSLTTAPPRTATPTRSAPTLPPRGRRGNVEYVRADDGTVFLRWLDRRDTVGPVKEADESKTRWSFYKSKDGTWWARIKNFDDWWRRALDSEVTDPDLLDAFVSSPRAAAGPEGTFRLLPSGYVRLDLEKPWHPRAPVSGIVALRREDKPDGGKNWYHLFKTSRAAKLVAPELAHAGFPVVAKALAAATTAQAEPYDAKAAACDPLRDMADAPEPSSVKHPIGVAVLHDVERAMRVGAPAKMKLFPYQTVGVGFLKLLGYRGIIGDAPGLGKCVARGTLIATEAGVRPIDDYGAEAALPGFSERVCTEPLAVGGEVHRFYREDSEKEARQVTTKYGYMLTGTLAHRMLVRDEQGHERLLPISDVRPGMWAALYRGDCVEREPLRLPPAERDDSCAHAEVHALPTHLTAEFAEWLGLYIADGSCSDINAVHVTVYDAVERAAQVAATRSLFPTVSIRDVRGKGRTEGWAFNSVYVRRWLDQQIGVDYSTARSKTIPPIVLRAGGRVLGAFLRGLFHDACCLDAGGIEFSTASERMSREVQTALLRLGIACSRKPKPVNGWTYWRLTLFGGDATVFAERVGMPLQAQRERLAASLSAKRNTNNDVVPLPAATVLAVVDALRAAGKFGRVASDDRLYCSARKVAMGQNISYSIVEQLVTRSEGMPPTVALDELRRVVREHYFWSPVVQNDDIGPIEVCDLEVSDDAHLYVADGFVTHNTAQSLAAAIVDPHELLPAAVVVPTSVYTNWQNEIRMWLPGVEIWPMPKRNSTPPPPGFKGIVVTKYSTVAEQAEGLVASGIRYLIVDEAHRVKNADAQQSQAVVALAMAVPHVVLLTGTPLKNRIDELWNLLATVDTEDYGNKNAFVDDYAETKDVWTGRKMVKQIVGVKNETALRARLKCVMIRRLKEDVAKWLPDKTRQYVTVEVDSSELANYKKAEQQFSTWLEGAMKQRVEAEVASEGVDLASMSSAERHELDREVRGRVARSLNAEAMARIGALRQLVGQMKVAPAIELIDDYVENEEPLIVFGVHKSVIDGLRKGLSAAKVRFGVIDGSTPADARGKLIDDFQHGRIDVIVGSEAMKEGVTLTRASNVMFVQRFWTSADEEQAEDRAHRTGQKNAVTISFLEVPNTIDQRLRAIIDSKRSLVAKVVGAASVAESDSTMATLLASFGDVGGGRRSTALPVGDAKPKKRKNPTYRVYRSDVLAVVFDKRWQRGAAKRWLTANGFDDLPPFVVSRGSLIVRLRRGAGHSRAVEVAPGIAAVVGG